MKDEKTLVSLLKESHEVFAQITSKTTLSQAILTGNFENEEDKKMLEKITDLMKRMDKALK